MNITNGIVSIEDGTKATEDFAPARKVRVELHFGVMEGADPVATLDGVRALADSRVQLMLNRRVAATVAATPAAEAAKPAETAKPETAAARKKREAAEAAANKPAEKTKDDLAREAGVLVDDSLDETPAKPAAAAKKDDDELNDLLGDTAPKPITDMELGKAAQEKNSHEKQKQGDAWAPAKIRDLIAEYAGAGKRINDIPADKRPEFMEKLKALK